MAATGIAAAAAGGASAVGGATAATAVAYAAIAAAATYASQSMARRQAEAAQRSATVEGGAPVSFRSSIAARRLIYGRTRVGGALTYIASAKTGNGTLLVDVAFAGHEVDAIEAVWLDEERLTLEPQFYNLGRVERQVYTQDPDTGEITVTTEVVDPGLQSPVYVPASGKYRPRSDYVAFMCEIDKLGSSTQSASELLRVLSPGGEWTTDHRLRGIAHLPMAFIWAPDIYQAGTPNPSLLVRGKRVYDPRTTSTAWSDNAALCLLDYLLDTRLGLGASLTEIDTASFIDAAGVCDEIVSTTTGSERRYTVGGALSADTTHEDNLASLLAAMDGKLSYVGGKFRLYAGAWSDSIATLTEDDLRRPITMTTQQERAKVFNAVRGIGAFPENNYQPTDYPPVVVPTYVTEDEGETLYADVPQPLVTSVTQAQRLARIAIERSRRQLVVQWPGKISALAYAPGDTIALTMSRYGWTAKTFTIDELRLVVDSDANGNPLFGVDLILRAHDANVFAWTTADEQPLPQAPATNLPNPFVVQPPGNLVAADDLVEVRGTVQSRVVLTATPSPDAFATAYQFEYRAVGASAWTPLARVPLPFTTIDNLPAGRYSFRAAAASVFAISPYVTIDSFTVSGLAAAPSALADVTLQTAGGLAVIQWTRSADLDVRNGGRIEFRHTPATVGAAWSAATPIGAPADGGASSWVVAFKPGTYLVRPYDSSGIAGPVTVLPADGATALTYTSLSTLTEESAFAGTKTGTVVASSRLKLSALGNVDAEADFDAIPDMDGLGGIAPEGSYTFATTMNLGSVKRVRVVSHIKAGISAVTDLIDSRVASIDEWPSFDGGDGDEAEAWVEFRDSPDGVTYSDWRRCDASEAQNRYFQFRAQLRSYDTNYNIEIEELRASANEVV